ncbi:hypothetical protein GQ457_02G032940 [Hibiscus cannabinus]
MSYSSEQGHYSSTGSSSPSLIDAIKGNEISNARDTTHEKPTLEKPESLDDIEADNYLADGTEKVQCNHCKFKLSKNKDGTTTQYKRHLDCCTWKYDQAKIREVVSHMIMVHELPFAFTEYELFTLLMKTVNPHYVKISRATTKAYCWTSYEVEKKRLNGCLKTMDKISVTTNMWKLGQKIQYMVLTTHFVDSDWNLQKRIH